MERPALRMRRVAVTHQVDPDSPALYIVQSNTPKSLRAQNTPLRETIARKSPPEPRTAMEGTWKFWTTVHLRSFLAHITGFKEIVMTGTLMSSFIYLIKKQYFLNLEKRHHRNEANDQLKIKEDEFATDKEILNQCQNSYEDLYKSCIVEHNLDNLFSSFAGLNVNTPSENERENWEGLLSKGELLKVLEAKESKDSPGLDGIPAQV